MKWSLKLGTKFDCGETEMHEMARLLCQEGDSHCIRDRDRSGNSWVTS